MKRKHKKLLLAIGGYIVLLIIATPTLTRLIKHQIEGKGGVPLQSFKFQPIYPIMGIITLGAVLTLLPFLIYKEFFKKK